MRPTTRIRCAVLALGGALALLAASAAQADIRYAAPGATNVSPGCPQADPCPIRIAIEGLPVVDGDTVLLEPGTYDLEGAAALAVADEVDIRPAQPGTRPRILNTGEPVFYLGSGAILAGLQVESAAIGTGVGVIHSEAAGEVVRLERMVVLAPSLAGSQGIAVRRGGMEIVDSAVYVSGAGSNAIEVYVTVSPLDSVIRNSTLVAGGTGSVAIEATSPFVAVAQALEIVNSILDGDPVAIATSNGGGPAGAELAVTVRYSNLGAVSDPPGDDSSVTMGAGNQLAATPLLANPAAGDFTELTGSPTIDAGLGDGLSGPLDLLGGPRVLGAGVDIGADEYPPPPVTEPPAVDDPPETTITKGPKRRQRTKGKRAKAKFEFTSSESGSSFECKLDKAGWQPCASPYEMKLKAKRKPKDHALLVRATDAAGKLDQTPAEYRWTIKRKR